MFYLLLIFPHVLAIGGLLTFALCSAAGGASGEPEEGSDGGGGGLRTPPSEPQSPPSGGGLPLGDAEPPRRRLRVGEQLSELHHPPARREHERDPQRPSRTPAER
jgi:hypothetical protein